MRIGSQSTVPGGSYVATAGLTRIGVLPTHVRRGVFRELVTELLRDALTAGEVLAQLRATEGTIYGRIGFGVAGMFCDYEIERRSARLQSAAPAEGAMRIIASDKLLDVVPPLYDVIARRRPGAIGRPPWMWKRYLGELLDGSRPARWVAVHSSDDGVDDGWVDYEISRTEEFGTEQPAAVTVHDLYGANAEVERTLWAYLLGIGHTNTIRAEERPLDDPVRWMLSDPRSVHVRWLGDEQWVRLLDVPAALGNRTYGPGSIIIAVGDELMPANDGTYRIADGAVERVEAAPDLTADVATLSAAFLGGTSWAELVNAGRASVHRSGAVAEADVMFASRPLPCSGSFY